MVMRMNARTFAFLGFFRKDSRLISRSGKNTSTNLGPSRLTDRKITKLPSRIPAISFRLIG